MLMWMMKRVLVLALFSLLCLSYVHAGAVVEGVPMHINFHEKPVMLEFSIENTASHSVPVEVILAMPVDYEAVTAVESLEAGERADFSFELTPKSAFTGTRYRGTVLIKAGGEEVRKAVGMSFGESLKEGADEEDQDKMGVFGLVVAGNFNFLSNYEFILDVVLVFISAILLVAFISRLVKRYSNGRLQVAAERPEGAAAGKGRRADNSLETIKSRITEGGKS
jgi:hypothetical protein